MVKKSKRAFRTISEAAHDLDVPQHVLRFWETKFSAIKPMKRGGKRRFYRPSDIRLLKAIKHTLYDRGQSIKAVQLLIKKSGVKTFVADWKAAAGFVEPAEEAPVPAPAPEPAVKAKELEEPGLSFEPEAEPAPEPKPQPEPQPEVAPEVGPEPAPEAAPEATPEAAAKTPADDDTIKISKDLVRALVADLKALRALIDRIP